MSFPLPRGNTTNARRIRAMQRQLRSSVNVRTGNTRVSVTTQGTLVETSAIRFSARNLAPNNAPRWG